MTVANPIGDGEGATSVCNSDALREAKLERDINAAYARLIAATDWDAKLVCWREMVRLIDQRTPARVRFMERTRGLR